MRLFGWQRGRLVQRRRVGRYASFGAERVAALGGFGGVCILKLLFPACFGSFLFCMFAAACYPLVVTAHAVDALAGLCKDELFDLGVARATGEAGGVIGFFASHDGFLHDGEVADVARVVALAADGMSVG